MVQTPGKLSDSPEPGVRLLLDLGLIGGDLDLNSLREFPRLTGVPQSSRRDRPTRLRLTLTMMIHLGTGPLFCERVWIGMKSAGYS